MKNIASVILLTFGITGAYAQESTGLTSKKGEPILPEANDWAVSFDAVPFMNYMGNLFSGSTTVNTSPGATWVNPTTMTITGKLFKDEKTAYRATVRLGMSSMKTTKDINDATVTTAPVYPNLPAVKEDEWKKTSSFVGLGGGIEKRRGKTRLQGVYGAELMFWVSGGKNKFTYGNALAVTAPIVSVSPATTTDFGTTSTSTGSNLAGVTDSYGNAARVVEDKQGAKMGFGVRGFIGAEYFLFPKISIGAEYGWGIGVARSAAGTQTKESVGGSPQSVGQQTTETSKSGSFGFDTDINGGTGSGTTQLKVTFHF